MKLISTLILAAALLTVHVSAQADSCYSDGVRTGMIQKFSKKGFFVKSWEGQLVMEGTSFKSTQNGTKGGNVWAFSVIDPLIAKDVEDAVMLQKPVALKYCQTLIPLLDSSTGYRITKVVVQK